MVANVGRRPQQWAGVKLLFLCTCVSLSACARQQDAGDTQHPFLFFSNNDLSNLRLEADTNRRESAQRLRQAVASMLAKPEHYLPPADASAYGDHWNEIYGNNIVPLAVHSTLWPSAANGDAVLDMLRTYADRMAAADSWFVRALPHDEVPVAHSLIGFTLAYDAAYARLDAARRSRYLAAIARYGRRLYVRAASNTTAWARTVVHNHTPTIVLAVMAAAMVAEKHGVREAVAWRHRATLLFMRNMHVLRLVVDGSLNEAVAYGSYTSWSLTQMAVLVRRRVHVDVTDNPWFAKHLDFLRHTLLPGYRETVGIGDSSPTWFYGPESQLHFLERFVLRTGEANWLAARIRERRATSGRLLQAEAHRWTALHTELVWSDPSVGETALGTDGARLHVFSDWGVAVFGGGTPSGATFLSFKCGVYNGRAQDRLARAGTWPFIQGWRSFNPGHEHPDQGSFVFYPRGRPFITSSLYGPKMTQLNNVLVFSPAVPSDGRRRRDCTWPLQGQLGGTCDKWLDYKDPETHDMAADIVTASSSGGERDLGMALMLGEYSGSYSPALGLASVQRATVLLSPDVLLVVDTVALRPTSELAAAHAFFHNNQRPFRLAADGRSAWVHDEDGRHTRTVTWTASHGQSVRARTASVRNKAEYRTRETHFLNASFPVSTSSPRHVAWLFSTDAVRASRPRFTGTHADAVFVAVRVDGVDFSVGVATELSSVEARVAALGSPAMASVDVNGSRVHFGVAHRAAAAPAPASAPPLASAAWLSVDGAVHVELMAVVLCGLPLLLCVYLLCRRSYASRRYATRAMQVTVVVWLVAASWLVLRVVSGGATAGSAAAPPGPEARRAVIDGRQGMPEIVVTALPGSGMEILEDVLRTDVGIRNLSLQCLPPTAVEAQRLLFAGSGIVSCPRELDPIFAASLDVFAGWLRSVLADPAIYLRSLGDGARQPAHDALATLLEKQPGACTALFSDVGGWNTHGRLLGELLGDTGRVVFLLRDPRSWVAEHMAAAASKKHYAFIRDLLRELRAPSVADQQLRGCSVAAREYALLAEEVERDEEAILKSPHRLLALAWAINTRLSMLGAVQVDSPTPTRFVLPVEMLLEQPEETIERLFRWLGLPLRPLTLHRLLSVANTGMFNVHRYRPLVRAKFVKSWWQLSASEVREVEELTHDARRQIRTFEGHVYLPDTAPAPKSRPAS